jgi:hypothetical protein
VKPGWLAFADVAQIPLGQSSFFVGEYGFWGVVHQTDFTSTNTMVCCLDDRPISPVFTALRATIFMLRCQGIVRRYRFACSFDVIGSGISILHRRDSAKARSMNGAVPMDP